MIASLCLIGFCLSGVSEFKGPVLVPGISLIKIHTSASNGQLIIEAGFKNIGNQDAWIDSRLIEGHHLTFAVQEKESDQKIYPLQYSKARVRAPMKNDLVRLRPGFSLLRQFVLKDLSLSEGVKYIVRIDASHGSSPVYASDYGITLSPILKHKTRIEISSKPSSMTNSKQSKY